jgi:hypothetical protein
MPVPCSKALPAMGTGLSIGGTPVAPHLGLAVGFLL